MPRGIYNHKSPSKLTMDKMKKSAKKAVNPGRFKKGHPAPRTAFKKGNPAPKTAYQKRDKRIIGKNNSNWKGGVTSIKDMIRQLPEYFIWRSDIFQRDNWTCQTCGKRGCYLEAHHNKELYKIIEENNIQTLEQARKCKELWNLDNGVTLCIKCHGLTKKGRGGKNFS